MGKAIAIDPYSASAAVQHDNRVILDPIAVYLDSRDWERIYQDFIALLRRNDLLENCELLRMTSGRATSLVPDRLDLLHIDGNHDFAQVRKYLTNYLPKLRVGGFLIMDDVNWETIRPHYLFLRKQMNVVYEAKNWGCCQKRQEAIEILTRRE